MYRYILTSFIAKFTFLFLRTGTTASFPPPLSAAEEREYFLKMKNGDADARNELIIRNLRLVAHIIKKYYTNYDDQEDLISIGTIGLIKAIDTYDIKNGTRFATYAGKCLQNEILMHFRSQKKLALESSIDDTIEIDKDGNPLTYIDIISVDDNIIEQIDLKSKKEMIEYAVKKLLDKRERAIIELRYGLENTIPITQREVAQKMGISRSYVSRIEKSALKKIHDYITLPKNYI
ncbi:MAG: sigma-70 family RNA polymerase sigma factor [Ruminococcaceae bacterium]|nr:sigma-70 family RNA polymerase sigma factor [Oscillospiraceae bacterium]